MSETEAFGRYVLEKKLGRGGMAEVFLAHHNDRALYSEPLVIKRVLSHLKENRTFLEMFLREARMVASFAHPNIIKIIDLGKVGTDFFIAMEFVDGLTVDSLGRRFFAQGEPVPVPLVAQLIADAALGLDHVHRARAADGKSPVVHRDISPDNLMVNTDGVTKILDFGIARPEGEENLTKTGVIKGKIPFMPPEQIESKKLDGRTDLYALGVSMFWLLTERRPFDRGTPLLTMSAIVLEAAPPPTRFRPDLPPLVDDIVLQLLEKDPELRIPTGAALAEALAPLLTLSRAEVAAVVQRKAREVEPPKRRPLLMEQPSDRSQPNETRVVPRRDSPESAMFVARTAVTPSDDRVSPGAVTRATFVGDVVAQVGDRLLDDLLVDEHSRTGAFVEGVQRIAPNAETLRFSEAPIVATDAHIAPAMLAQQRPRDPTVTVFQPSDGKRSSSTTKGAIAGALVFTAVAAVVVFSLSGGDEPAIARASAPPATSSPSTTTLQPKDPARPTEKDQDDRATAPAPVEGGQAPVDPVDDDARAAESEPAPEQPSATGEELAADDDDEPAIADDVEPDAPSDRRARDPRDRRRPTQATGNAAAASASSSNAASSASAASTPLTEREAPEPAVDSPKPSKSMRVLSVRAPAHVRFLDGGKRVKPKGNELSVPLSTKSLIAHDTVRDVKTKIPVSDLPIDYDVLPKGTLSIRAVPFAQVYFGKESVGTTPLPSLKVVVGTYKVRLVYEDKEIERVVEVRPGDLTRISENMTK